MFKIDQQILTWKVHGNTLTMKMEYLNVCKFYID